jgi:hypothetical protein
VTEPVARHQVRDMPATGAEVESARRSHAADHNLQGLEIRAACMNRAFNIGFGARPELGVNELLMSFVHRSVLLRPAPALGGETWITID